MQRRTGVPSRTGVHRKTAKRDGRGEPTFRRARGDHGAARSEACAPRSAPWRCAAAAPRTAPLRARSRSDRRTPRVRRRPRTSRSARRLRPPPPPHARRRASRRGRARRACSPGRAARSSRVVCAARASCVAQLARRPSERQSLLRSSCKNISTAIRTGSQRHRHCVPVAELVSPRTIVRVGVRGPTRRSNMTYGAPHARRFGAAEARGRATRFLRAGSCVALLAVLTQLALPHVHRWLASDHALERAGHTTATGSPNVTADDRRGDTAHADPECATCQALAQTRTFLTSRAEIPRPVGTASRRSEAPRVPAPQARGVAHAPRSPPARA